MKITKKFSIGLAVVALIASHFLVNINQPQAVQAAKQVSKGKITFIKNDYLYDKFGHKIKVKRNTSPDPFMTDQQGYKIIYTYEDSDFNYYAINKINGQKYYDLGGGNYVNAAVVKDVNQKDTKKGKLVLANKSLIYTAKGKPTGQSLAQNAIVTYYGKVRPTTTMPKYFFYDEDLNKQKQIFYLPTKTINNKQYYALGQNRYLRADNIASIDGHIARYNGVSSATLLATAKTSTLSQHQTNHLLKKGQKIKIDLAVIPRYLDGFEGYSYRLHDYPDEYIDEADITFRNDLPIVDYTALAFNPVTPVTGNSIKLFDFTGNPSGISIQTTNNNSILIDGLFYLWLPSEHKATLFYHFLNYDNPKLINDQTQQPLKQNDLPNNVAAANYSNYFIKASDVQFNNQNKLQVQNTKQQAQNDQVIATNADKSELQKLFMSFENTNKVITQYSDLKANYRNALTNSSQVLRSNKATIAQVNEATWLLETTSKQLISLDFPLGD
ncbi:hypothetical protein F5ESL0233_00495 [Lactobacillus sp. ESL0233]|uniref:SLAP domain-containing protein n=1 Tax=Lactobacillus sp. ESL0233 TaxID=2069354 RepID=UPI000EFC1769|nr:SLAP domain-containing protein [Lactobacillus sp. ESL0233]RMC42705.1 hypothetical protein F5ESL0233_00495 [Lactobacillus sp. ESL0233]